MDLGRVTNVEPVEFPKPEVGFYPGTPYRVRFAVDETIKGASTKSLDVILCLQHRHEIDYLRDRKCEVMLVGSRKRFDPEAEIGLEPLDSHYSFRLLKPIPVRKGEEDPIGRQLNITFDSGRMFDIDFRVISRREDLLRRARDFARKHHEELETGGVGIPREFAQPCGYPNAFATLILPVCPEAKDRVEKLIQKPDRLFRGVPAKESEFQRGSVLRGLQRFLEEDWPRSSP